MDDSTCTGPSAQLFLGDNIVFSISCNLWAPGFMGIRLYLVLYRFTKTAQYLKNQGSGNPCSLVE